VAASAELGTAAHDLAAKVRAIEGGDRELATGIDRRDELGQVDAALDQLARQLGRLEADRQRLDHERAVMLSSISHDLRSPLAALRAAVDALLDGVAPDPQRYLRSMRADVDALASLVDDVFLLTSLDGGQLQLERERVDLAECCDEAIEALAPAAHAQGVHIELVAEHRVLVPANSRALGRVVRNLIDNAVRHAPTGSTVTVTVGRSERPLVTVSDQGDGFPEGFAEVAFDRWTRPDQSRSRMTGGSGLGLAIAHGLVAAHGGRIWIDDSAGGQVSFELPAPN
jgi:two-component system sensor histidine kinase BaeS